MCIRSSKWPANAVSQPEHRADQQQWLQQRPVQEVGDSVQTTDVVALDLEADLIHRAHVELLHFGFELQRRLQAFHHSHG